MVADEARIRRSPRHSRTGIGRLVISPCTYRPVPRSFPTNSFQETPTDAKALQAPLALRQLDTHVLRHAPSKNPSPRLRQCSAPSSPFPREGRSLARVPSPDLDRNSQAVSRILLSLQGPRRLTIAYDRTRLSGICRSSSLNNQQPSAHSIPPSRDKSTMSSDPAEVLTPHPFSAHPPC